MLGTIVLSITWGNTHAGHNRTQYHVEEQASRAHPFLVTPSRNRHAGHNSTMDDVGDKAVGHRRILVPRFYCRVQTGKLQRLL
jgi:hypothetical protein